MAAELIAAVKKKLAVLQLAVPPSKSMSKQQVLTYTLGTECQIRKVHEQAAGIRVGVEWDGV